MSTCDLIAAMRSYGELQLAHLSDGTYQLQDLAGRPASPPVRIARGQASRVRQILAAAAGDLDPDPPAEIIDLMVA